VMAVVKAVDVAMKKALAVVAAKISV